MSFAGAFAPGGLHAELFHAFLVVFVFDLLQTPITVTENLYMTVCIANALNLSPKSIVINYKTTR